MMNIIEEAKRLSGTAGIYYKNIATGETLTYNSGNEFHPASIIKLPIFMAVSRMAAAGEIDLSERLRVTADKVVGGSGAFPSFTFEPVVDLETLMNLMITISDNTAANLIIERIGIDKLNREFSQMGMSGTRVERQFYDDDMQALGYNNKVVPAELGELLEQVYHRSFVNKEVSERVLKVLLNQQFRNKIPAYIEHRCPVGNKTGESGKITGDAALILGRTPFILVMIFNDTFAPEADAFMAQAGRYLYEENKK